MVPTAYSVTRALSTFHRAGNMAHPTFTTIIASYNHERYVEAAVVSILAQTIPFDRIIWFDDGSRDRTREIVRAHLRSHAGFEEMDQLDVNKGLMPRLVAANRRVGDGYVIPMSGDDVLTPRAVEIHRDLVARTGALWTVAATQITDAALQPTFRVAPPPDVRAHPEILFERLLCLDPWIPMTGWAYSTELFRRVGGYDAGHRVEDYSLGLRFARASMPAFSEEVVKYWRRVDGSLTVQLGAELWRDHARVALQLAADRPLLARRAAALHLDRAARSSLHAGQFRDAVRDQARAVGYWPSPMRFARQLRVFATQGPLRRVLRRKAPGT